MVRHPFYLQPDLMDCGPTCLQMVAKYHGRYYSLTKPREHSHITGAGVSMHGISDAAESIGFRSMGVKIGFDKMQKDAPLPLIAHCNREHFLLTNDSKGMGLNSKSDSNCSISCNVVVWIEI